MKRVIVVCLLFFTCEFHICAQQEWNQTYELYDAKIVDTYYDYENSTQWVLVIGVSKEDMKYNLNHESPLNTLLLVNLKTGGKTIIPNYFVFRQHVKWRNRHFRNIECFFFYGYRARRTKNHLLHTPYVCYR